MGRFLVEAHALWQAYSSVRESNPLSGRVALYRAGRLHAKYVLHVPDPPLDYCFALEEVRFLETLQTIENQQQSGQPISNEKRQQLLQIWDCDLLPIKENENDNPTQIFNSKELSSTNISSTNISRANENGPAVSNNIRKHDRALKNHKIKLRDVETKLIQALSSKQKAIDLLKRVKTARNMHREKTVAAKEKLKVAKKKNVALSKMLSAEKSKSADINHRAWRDKKENLTLLTETTQRFNEELKKRQDENEEKLLNERRRLKKGQDELSAERLLRTYLQHKYDKKLKKEIEGGSKKREEEKKKNEKEKKKMDKNHERECNELEKKNEKEKKR